MEKNALEMAIKEGLTTYQMAERFKRSQTNVRYWLKKHKLKLPWRKGPRGGKFCLLCDKKTGGKKICNSCHTKIRRYRTKIAAVELLGGKCKSCGWSGPVVGFDFHHRNDKEFSISRSSNKAWETVKKELEKCDLLCAICHRVLHSSCEDEKLLEIVQSKIRG